MSRFFSKNPKFPLNALILKGIVYLFFMAEFQLNCENFLFNFEFLFLLYTASLITTTWVITAKVGIEEDTGFRVHPGMTNYIRLISSCIEITFEKLPFVDSQIGRPRRVAPTKLIIPIFMVCGCVYLMKNYLKTCQPEPGPDIRIY